MLDERWIRSLHVESMRHADLHAEREPHVLFQASTIGALLDGAYRRRPHLRRAGRARRSRPRHAERARRRDDRPRRRASSAPTSTATSTWCGRRRRPRSRWSPASSPRSRRRSRGRSHTSSCWPGSTQLIPAGASSCAIRLDGRFELVRARSVPRQRPPYRPLTEVVAEQHVFDFADVAGTMLGFRFPGYVEGIEVAGYHLHFISEDRSRGGHVLDSALRPAGPARPLQRPPRRAAAGGSTSPTPTSPPPPTRRSSGSRRPGAGLAAAVDAPGLVAGDELEAGGDGDARSGSGRWGRG